MADRDLNSSANKASKGSPVATSGVTTLFHLTDLLHGNMMNIVKDELCRIENDEINPVQAVFIYRMNTRTLKTTEFRSTGVYLGSNASYNVRHLVATGYMERLVSTHNRRGMAYRLTDKGFEIRDLIQALSDRLMTTIIKELRVTPESVADATKILEGIDSVISGQIRHIW
jgi:DNA-binding MarR family transcriptional regulator